MSNSSVVTGEKEENVTVPDIHSKAFDQLISDIAADFKKRSNEEGRQHPFKGVQLIKEFRLGAIRLPKNAGGAGSSFVDLFTAVIRIAEADPDVAHIIRAHFMTVESLLQSPETPLRKKIVEAVGNGAIIGNAYTENSKHQAGGYEYDTKLTKEGDHYLLNGEKIFTTGTYYSDYTEVKAMLHGSPTLLIVPVSREGVTVLDDWDGIGQKMTGSGTTIFENVVVEANETFTDRQKKGQYAPVPHLYLQAIIAGIVRNIVTDATDLIHKRKRSFFHGNTNDLKQDVQLQQVVGQLSSFAFAAEAMVLAAAKSVDDASEYPDSAAEHNAALRGSQVKVAIEELAFKAATLLFEVGGASATIQSANLDRHWRNIRTLASHNPTLYKARAIGDYYINNELLPDSAYF
ncbi:alkylation response protein AidB-like acyl-CoA dehydrogenase [Virgibacillus natechei]|uniref:Dibenzothiophene monooxygenase n=1 Tax=Virgibacillus natechei TaxID=1216297 RepID=A0ABS4ILF0_9BACI|nr:acyl-CoA dehydrogenase family protein [Virgibacillus natechei]MBP1971375.1 alkylation response protein AidB-like acyl-CoA dehydrogenase [Virgibacillus natechei]UZD12251.1 acyl-CoA dehydrogenase family protein [Virgibacillus natechei]